jgi:hypothetical protein
MQYRCYYFGTSGQLLGADTVNQDCDGDALVAARKLFAEHAHAVGYELRQGSRSVDVIDLSYRKRPQANVPRAA